MLNEAKVIWFEGMLLTPQHFQQQERYFEYLFKHHKINLGIEQNFGLKKITISTKALALNRIMLEEVAGIFPDGTPFFINASAHNALIKQHLVIEANATAQKIYLCLPLQSTYRQQIADEPDHQYRYQTEMIKLKDTNADESEDASVVTGMLNLSLRTDAADLSNYMVIPIAKIKYCNEKEGIVLDENFIPPLLATELAPILCKEISHIAELLQERVKALAQRIGNFDSQNKTHFNELLLLQTLNRHVLTWQQGVKQLNYPPLYFYNLALAFLGDLATFTLEEKYWPEALHYQHENLEKTFVPILTTIRSLLNKAIDYSTMSVHLERTAQGFWVSKILANSILDKARLIIAVKADLPQGQLQEVFPNQAKIAGIEQIQDLIFSHLPGLPLIVLATIPSVLTYHPGFIYFEVQKTTYLWEALLRSGQIALHVPGEFTKFQMYCWLIKDA